MLHHLSQFWHIMMHYKVGKELFDCLKGIFSLGRIPLLFPSKIINIRNVLQLFSFSRTVLALLWSHEPSPSFCEEQNIVKLLKLGPKRVIVNAPKMKPIGFTMQQWKQRPVCLQRSEPVVLN